MPIGRIYRIVFPDQCYYIGSTVQSLTTRLADHIYLSQSTPDRPIHRKGLEHDWKCEIEIIEEVDSDVLYEYEDVWIRSCKDDELCLNVYNVIETKEDISNRKKQYHVQNAAERCAKQRAYYQRTKEIQKQKERDKYWARKRDNNPGVV
jgi:hypothetical protein